MYYNQVHKRVGYRGNPDLSALAGKTLWLRFVMRDCKLYAFQFPAAEA